MRLSNGVRSAGPTPQCARGAAERGSVTPIVAASCIVVIVLGGAASLAVSAAVAASRARSAADLSAVAGAGVLVSALDDGSPDACGAAAVVAERNGAELTACEIDRAVNLTVEVSVDPKAVVAWPAGLGRAVARARAGPQPAGGEDRGTGPAGR